jgi:hypothetical protein
LLQRILVTLTESVFQSIATIGWVIWDLFVGNIKRKDLNILKRQEAFS